VAVPSFAGDDQVMGLMMVMKFSSRTTKGSVLSLMPMVKVSWST